MYVQYCHVVMIESVCTVYGTGILHWKVLWQCSYNNVYDGWRENLHVRTLKILLTYTQCTHAHVMAMLHTCKITVCNGWMIIVSLCNYTHAWRQICDYAACYYNFYESKCIGTTHKAHVPVLLHCVHLLYVWIVAMCVYNLWVSVHVTRWYMLCQLTRSQYYWRYPGIFYMQTYMYVSIKLYRSLLYSIMIIIVISDGTRGARGARAPPIFTVTHRN